jgi:hydrogenase maturation protease
LRGLEPEEVVVLGMQPEVIELGWELSPTVSARLDLLVDMAVNELARWGVTIGAQESKEMEVTACTK